MVELAASPASFQPSKAAIITGSLRAGNPSNSITGPPADHLYVQQQSPPSRRREQATAVERRGGRRTTSGGRRPVSANPSRFVEPSPRPRTWWHPDPHRNRGSPQLSA